MRRRRLARICALQALYLMEINPMPAKQALDIIVGDFPPYDDIDDGVRAFALQLVTDVAGYQDEIDKAIQSASTNWRLNRMAAVDRNILRLGVYELFYCEDIPKRVTLNEAIELGKTFGTEDSGSFINGVLDNISKAREKE